MDPLPKRLVPAKFLSMTLHLLAVCLNYDMAHENIVTGLGSRDKLSQEYDSAQRELMFVTSLMVTFLSLEYLILLQGNTLFNNKSNLLRTSPLVS